MFFFLNFWIINFAIIFLLLGQTSSRLTFTHQPLKGKTSDYEFTIESYEFLPSAREQIDLMKWDHLSELVRSNISQAMTVTLYYLRVFSIDRSDMVGNKTSPVARAKVDRVAIIRSLAIAAW
jgi:hypothetical protein